MINLTINNLYLGTFVLSTAVAIAERLSMMFPGITAIFEPVPPQRTELHEAIEILNRKIS